MVKGRAFGSPLAGGLYPRASKAKMAPRAKPGALTRDVNTLLSAAEADPQTKPEAPAAAPAAVKNAVRRTGFFRKFALFVLAAAVVSSMPGCRPKAVFPGRLIVLAQSNILAVTQEGAEIVLADVMTAALSPDGRYLLYSNKDQTLLRDVPKGTDKLVLAESAQTAGWNGEGTWFYILTGCDTNRLYAGQVDRGGPIRISQGKRGLFYTGTDEDGAAIAEQTCAEVGGCLFLNNETLVFSAFDGFMPRQGDIFANKAFLVRLDVSPPEIKSVDFAAKERWRFVDVGEAKDLILMSIEKNPESPNLFEDKVFVSPRFKDLAQLEFQNEMQLGFSRWENGSWGVAGELACLFMPSTNRLFGLASEEAKNGRTLYYVLIDPETGEAQRGPGLDLAPGQVINRPVFDPDERYAALLCNLGARMNITLIDLQENSRSVVWKIKSGKGEIFDARRDRLLGWLDSPQ